MPTDEFPINVDVLRDLLVGEFELRKGDLVITASHKLKAGLSGAALWLVHLRETDTRVFRFGVVKIPAEDKNEDVEQDHAGFELMQQWWPPENLPKRHFLFRNDSLVKGRPEAAVSFCSFADEHSREDTSTLTEVLQADNKKAEEVLRKLLECYKRVVKKAYSPSTEGHLSDPSSEPENCPRPRIKVLGDAVKDVLGSLRRRITVFRRPNGDVNEDDEACPLIQESIRRDKTPHNHLRSMLHADLLAKIEVFSWRNFGIEDGCGGTLVDIVQCPNSLCALRRSELFKDGIIDLPYIPIHGDLNPDNIVVRKDGGFVFVDFEKVRQGPPQYDLAFLLMWLIKQTSLSMLNTKDNNERNGLANLAFRIARYFDCLRKIQPETGMMIRDRFILDLVENVFRSMISMVDNNEIVPSEFEKKGAQIALSAAALARAFYEFRDAERLQSKALNDVEHRISGRFYHDLSCCALSNERLVDSRQVKEIQIPKQAAPSWKFTASTADGSKNFEFPLAEGEYLIGRGNLGAFYIDISCCDPDSKVSRDHAALRVAHGGLSLRDKGSMNGTAVDGRRIPTERDFPITVDSAIVFANAVRCRVQPRPAEEPGETVLQPPGLVVLEGGKKSAVRGE